MNDRYLFKAKRIDNGEWICGSLITGVFHREKDGADTPYILNVDKSNATCFEDFTEGGEYFEVDPETICQCTGLKDKNGKLIYENDIISGYIDDDFPEDETKEHVLWHENGWHTKELGSIDYEEDLDDFALENYEVIGNIFDNPELLESEE